jgi:hypothetical protein
MDIASTSYFYLQAKSCQNLRYLDDPLVRGGTDFGQTVDFVQTLVLFNGCVVIRQDVHLVQMGQSSRKRTGLTNVLIVVVDPRNDRHSQEDVVPSLRKHLQISQEQLVGHPGEFSMLGIIYQLEVVQKQVHVFPDVIQSFPGCEAAGVQGSVNLFFFAGPKESEQKVQLKQRLSARKGYASPRFVVKWDVPFDLGHHLRHSHFLACDLARFSVADLNTIPTERTVLSIGEYHITVPGDCTLRTDRLASPTPDTPTFSEYQFWLRSLALGIVAPPATQRTSFEKNRGTNTWPVVNGEFLDVKNDPLDQNRCL